MEYILIFEDSGVSAVYCGIVAVFLFAAWFTYWGFDSSRRFWFVLVFGAFAILRILVAADYYSAVASCVEEEGDVTEVIAHGRFHSLTLGSRTFHMQPHSYDVGFRDFDRLEVGDHVRYCHGSGYLFRVERSRR